MNTDLHFSSASEEWATPQDVFDRLDRVFDFVLDPCASELNHKCLNWFTKEQNGLKQDWSKNRRVFVNPPYGRGLIDWMRKSYEESQKGALVVCLVPARTDTKWFQEYAMKGEVKFLRGRLKFGGCKNAAPFPSAIVIFYPKGTF